MSNDTIRTSSGTYEGCGERLDALCLSQLHQELGRAQYRANIRINIKITRALYDCFKPSTNIERLTARNCTVVRYIVLHG